MNTFFRWWYSSRKLFPSKTTRFVHLESCTRSAWVILTFKKCSWTSWRHPRQCPLAAKYTSSSLSGTNFPFNHQLLQMWSLFKFQYHMMDKTWFTESNPHCVFFRSQMKIFFHKIRVHYANQPSIRTRILKEISMALSEPNITVQDLQGFAAKVFKSNQHLHEEFVALFPKVINFPFGYLFWFQNWVVINFG